MGYMLKEALRTMCGSSNNQWCYAVFWKIGCQNPNLLIWEECYYDPKPNSMLQSIYGNESKIGNLVSRIMLNSRIVLVGEGIAGRAAFTGRHQWLLANEFTKEGHPPEVVNELLLHFSAGLQTVAVIPIIPHGVVQIGSSLPVAENLGFVNDVKLLIMQLGRIPGALLSEDCTVQDSADLIGVPVSFPSSSSADSDFFRLSSLVAVGSKTQLQSRNLSYVAGQDCSVGQIKDDVKGGASKVQSSSMNQVLINPSGGQMTRASSNNSNPTKYGSDCANMEEISTGAGSWMNPSLASLDPVIDVTCGSFSGLSDSLKMEQQNCLFGVSTAQVNRTSIAKDSDFCQMKDEDLMMNSCGGSQKLIYGNYEHSSSRSHISGNVAGEDLFDMVGIDRKSESLEENWSKLLRHGVRESAEAKEMPIQMCGEDANSDFCSVVEGMQMFSGSETGTGTDLLDAVVLGAFPRSKNLSEDTDSCKTTLTKISCSAQGNASHKLQGLLGNSLPEAEMVKSMVETEGSSSLKNGFGKKDPAICSQTTSVYGSQISSWVEQVHNLKRESSASTSYSNRNEGSSKLNRKRLKPGESPRPRPKDRQMIQDRVKELREIIPNGGKCSIDALLERTIKHMLFLQSITKHADKLKQTGESKIIETETGPVLKDNFEGGATWAFDVGSQSMVCPIVVEDLNPPRNFLVEMLCEERGFFLEIADWIRGLGLTILKGVMEARNSRIWARFAVEANRDVTRMEIFMSLVQLLEQSMKGVVAPSARNMIVHNSIPQATTVPATVGINSHC